MSMVSANEEKEGEVSAVNQNVPTVNMHTNNQFIGTESFLRRYKLHSQARKSPPFTEPNVTTFPNTCHCYQVFLIIQLMHN